MAVIFSFCNEEKIPEGEVLAQTFCSSCHAFPEPQLLDRPTWEKYILPRMGQFMGIYQNEKQRDSLVEKGPAQAIIEAASIFPRKPALSTKEWLAIQAFYLKHAPDTLAADSMVSRSTTRFQAKFPNLFLSPPSTTFVSIEKEGLFFADANKQLFFQLDQQLEVSKQAKIGEGVVHSHRTADAFWLTTMGSFSPTDQAKGAIFRLSTDPKQASGIAIDQLQRPVHASYADFNQDGFLDVLVCEYGKWTGALSLWLQDAQGDFQRRNLLNRSGAIATQIIDLNQDGLLDFMALFGQGDESIQWFVNKGNLQFVPQKIVSLSPSHGSSSFALYDFNADGRQDIIYTAGDNADFPPILKPYHGVYIYLQQDDFQFQQAHFLPLPGAYRAIPADYDLDGDLDIAAISFFPDYVNAHQDFVLFEQTDSGFQATTMDLGEMGRWIVMDHGDIDQDGDEDLLLGALTFEAPQKPELIQKWVKNGIPFVLLENQTK
ncbi:MAG: VCBS repeat-containing protein [Bacteroidota bacterium]